MNSELNFRYDKRIVIHGSTDEVCYWILSRNCHSCNVYG